MLVHPRLLLREVKGPLQKTELKKVSAKKNGKKVMTFAIRRRLLDQITGKKRLLAGKTPP